MPQNLKIALAKSAAEFESSETILKGKNFVEESKQL